MGTETVVVSGLPESGKTTFLAALWQRLDNAKIDSPLRIEKLDADIAYLNQIRESWIQGKPLNRTTRGKIHPITFHLTDSNNKGLGKILIPDLSGEDYEGIWKERQLGRDLLDVIKPGFPR